MAILRLGLPLPHPCQYCWLRDGQTNCDKGPRDCVQMMGLTDASINNIREIRVYSCTVRILGIQLEGITVRNHQGTECKCKSNHLLSKPLNMYYGREKKVFHEIYTTLNLNQYPLLFTLSPIFVIVTVAFIHICNCYCCYLTIRGKKKESSKRSGLKCICEICVLIWSLSKMLLV